MDTRTPRAAGALRAVAVILAAALAGLALLVATGDRAIGGGLSPDTPRITGAQRDAGARYADTVPEQDRAWIEAAIAAARPEAQRLIAEVDGLVEYQVHRGDPLGVTRSEVSPGGARFTISFDVASLDGDRGQDRSVTVLHEYGHAIDLALIPQKLDDQLDAGIPRTGTCGNYGGAMTGSCAEPAERFADTFAKWALRGSVSAVGAGYQVANPPSLEDWGAPLAALAVQLAAPRH
ncbi:MAG TPA: hypothetical protein VFN44_05810 [Solirubrobacteraceae bacterium]|nr:hypothetical protein [Solirubrobacteraceae bacterium]